MTDPIAFGDFFTNTQAMYKYIIINPYEQYVRPITTSGRRLFAWATYWFIFACAFFVICMQILYTIDQVQRNHTMIDIIGGACWVPVSMISFEGVVFTWIKGKRVTRLIGNIEASFPATKEEQEFSSFRETYEQWNNMSKWMNRAYWSSVYTIYCQSAILAVIGYFLNGTVVLKMPRKLWYPFEINSIPLWVQIIIYLWECWLTMAHTRAVIASALIIGSLVIHICIQFDKLTHQFNELSPTGGKMVAKDSEKLIQLVRRHVHLLDICNELQDIFRLSLLVNYVLSSVVIGTLGFLILNESVISQKTEYILDLIAFVVYNSMFSFFGDSLMTRSGGINRAIYESNWLSAHLKYKKNLLFVMSRTSKPFMLNGFFFFVSYETYRKILTTSYSYLALLLAAYRKQK